MSFTTGAANFETSANSAATASIKPISDALNALVSSGALIKTTDTGQISWGSVSPTAIGTLGYEIFRLNDSLNASAPIFMKVTYLAGAASTNTGNITIQLGTASDGAGNLTGTVSSAIPLRAPNNTGTARDTTTRTFWAAAGDGYFSLIGCFAPSGTNSAGPLFFGIERLRDPSTGALTPDGIAVVTNWAALSASTTVRTQGAATWTTPTGSPTQPIASCFYTTFSNLNKIGVAANVGPLPVFPFPTVIEMTNTDGVNSYLQQPVWPCNGKIYAPSRLTIVAEASQLTEGSLISLTLLDAAHQFVCAIMRGGAIHVQQEPGGGLAAGSNVGPGSSNWAGKQVALRVE